MFSAMSIVVSVLDKTIPVLREAIADNPLRSGMHLFVSVHFVDAKGMVLFFLVLGQIM